MRDIHKEHNNLEDLQIAFRQLSFSIKLLTYIENEKIHINDFDIDINIIEEEQNVVLNSQEFTNITLRVSAEINVGICFGVASIVLWKGIESSRNAKKFPELITLESDLISSLIYSIRCCFAHDPSRPTWKLKGRHKLLIHFDGLEIDLRNIDGKIFEYSDIGGYETLWKLKEWAEENNMINPE